MCHTSRLQRSHSKSPSNSVPKLTSEADIYYIYVIYAYSISNHLFKITFKLILIFQYSHLFSFTCKVPHGQKSPTETLLV